jgi:glyceraldehyde 3-phosphate dehydrogenase
MIKVAINGFGRIGRNVLRAFHEHPHYRSSIQIVAINDLSPIEHSVHLLKYDSIHKIFDKIVTNQDNTIQINNHTMKYTSIKDAKLLPWAELDVDIVFDCTGKYTKHDTASDHLIAGAKRVVVSAPCDGADRTIVWGVNESSLVASDKIISNASCTTNCLAPIVALIHRDFDIKNGLMTTIHSYTGDQRLVDTDHSDLYRARAAALSMIPSKTGAAKAIGLIIPELKGKINGLSVRVPTPNVSLVDFTCNVNKDVTAEAVNNLFKTEVEKGVFNGVLGYNDEPLVSVDFNHDRHSSIYDSTQTIVHDGMVKVFAWYDNEWGFSNRMLDLAISISKLK